VLATFGLSSPWTKLKSFVSLPSIFGCATMG
jgi:hypothetical protein